MEEIKIKTCSRCKAEKPTIEFYKSKTSKDGYSSICSSCQIELTTDYRRRVKEGLKVDTVPPSSKPGFKICYTCRIEKPLEEFYRKNNTKDGYSGVCKLCLRAKGNTGTSIFGKTVEEYEEIFSRVNSIKELCLALNREFNQQNTTYLRVRSESLGLDWNKLKDIDTFWRGRHLYDDQIFIFGSSVDRTTLRKRIISKNLLDYRKCAICGISTWQGKEFPLILDHIDGDNHNNMLSNLRFICPNCDSQLPTWKGRNRNKNLEKINNPNLKLCPICAKIRIPINEECCHHCKNRKEYCSKL